MLGRNFVYADKGSAVTLSLDMLSHSDAKDMLSHRKNSGGENFYKGKLKINDTLDFLMLGL